MKTLLTLLLTFNAAQGVIACEHGFFPNNDLLIPTSSENTMAKNAESTVITEVITDIYQPIFIKDNKKLTINFNWKDPAVNAYATRDDQNNPVINVTGGMLGYELLTKDGLALILCHELGHFLGGEPKKLRGRSSKKSWSSAEGQADYFATASCIKKVFKELPDFIETEEVKKATDNKKSQKLRLIQESTKICKTPMCKRIALASHNVAKVYASLDWFSGELSLINKDEYTVYETIYSHPNPQCRLDTMIAALRCPNSEEIVFKNGDLIQSACENTEHRRPRCWFYPDTISF